MMNKTTLKLFALACAVCLACTCFAGCDLSNLFGGLDPVTQHPTAQLHVTHDYGMVRPGMATPLLDYCTVDFLDTGKWDLDVFLPGDVYVVTYTGELLVQESYPGTMVLQRGEILSVNRIDAGITKLEYGTLRALDAGVSISGELPQYVVLDEQGAYCALSEYQGGAVLYATYERDEAVRQADGTLSVTPLALYAFEPRSTHTARFEARYDYGFHKLGSAEILMDGSTVFIDRELIAGDVVYVGYTGTMLIQETYPSTVVFADGGGVERVDVIEARLCILKVVKGSDGEKMLVLEDGTPVASAPDCVLTDVGGTYTGWKLYTEGTEFYGSYTADQGDDPTEIAGLYTYMPRQ